MLYIDGTGESSDCDAAGMTMAQLGKAFTVMIARVMGSTMVI